MSPKLEPCEELYRQLFNPHLYLLAYGRLYSNKAMTPGVDGETVDGMSLAKIGRIIEALRYERYRFQPAKRIYIPKEDGKKRPLGLPSWSDKLVGEVIRLLLEAYYEPRFSDRSHGFRSGRGCHTALREVAHAVLSDYKPIPGTIRGTELIARLLIGRCEACEALGEMHVHHVRKLADLTTPGRPQPAKRRRKTLVVCNALPRHHPRTTTNRTHEMIAGEPDARTRASPARRGADGKRTSTVLEPRLSAYPAKLDEATRDQIGEVPDHEDVVRIPTRMMRFFPEVSGQ